MRAWVTPELVLYLARVRSSRDDVEAPDRPSADHEWVDGNGWVLNMTPVRTRASKEIDAKAEQVRLRYITPGSGQAGTYLIKEREAEAFRTANYEGDIPPMVQAEMDATGFTAQQATDLILGERDFWLAKAANIERERRKGKIAVQAASTLRTAAAARDAAITELDAL